MQAIVSSFYSRNDSYDARMPCSNACRSHCTPILCIRVHMYVVLIIREETVLQVELKGLDKNIVCKYRCRDKRSLLHLKINKTYMNFK